MFYEKSNYIDDQDSEMEFVIMTDLSLTETLFL